MKWLVQPVPVYNPAIPLSFFANFKNPTLFRWFVSPPMVDRYFSLSSKKALWSPRFSASPRSFSFNIGPVTEVFLPEGWTFSLPLEHYFREWRLDEVRCPVFFPFPSLRLGESFFLGTGRGAAAASPPSP